MKSRQKKSNSPFGPERNRAGAAVFSPRTQACSSRRWQLGVPYDPRKAHDLHFIGPRRGLAGASGGALSKRPGERWLDPRKRSGFPRLSPARAPVQELQDGPGVLPRGCWSREPSAPRSPRCEARRDPVGRQPPPPLTGAVCRAPGAVPGARPGARSL